MCETLRATVVSRLLACRPDLVRLETRDVQVVEVLVKADYGCGAQLLRSVILDRVIEVKLGGTGQNQAETSSANVVSKTYRPTVWSRARRNEVSTPAFFRMITSTE